MKKFITVFGSVVIIAALTVFSGEAAAGAGEGLSLCARTLVPSLFPALFASNFFALSGAAGTLGKRCSRFFEKAFGLPGEAGAAMFAAVTGGYPSGAAVTASLYGQGIITRSQAERTALVCVCAGPGFLVGAVGAGMYNCREVGVMLLIIMISSVAVSGFIMRFFSKKEEKSVRIPENEESADILTALTVSVRRASESMLNICAYTVLAFSLGALLRCTGISAAVSDTAMLFGVRRETAQAILPSLLEVTGGCAAAIYSGVPMTAFAAGFGGLCVHMQIFSILENVRPSKPKFILARFFCGVYCAALSKILLPLLPESALTASADIGFAAAFSRNAAGSAALIVMCLACVMCIPLPKNKKAAPRRS